jgi:hypothetical protein
VPAAAAGDAKAAVLAAIREGNKAFFGMVVASAQSIEVQGDSLVFTFAPAQKALRPQLEAKRGWIESLTQSAAGRKLSVVAKDGQPAPAAAPTSKSETPKADLKARAKAEPSVQAVLDVFGGEIEDVEEIQ